MPNPVAANDLQPISGSLQTSRISYGVETAGKNYGQNYNSTTWYSDIPNNGQFYTIISDNYTANYYVSRSNAGGAYVEGGLPAVDEYSAPVFWVTVGTSSLDITTVVNGLPDRIGQTPFNSGSQALNWVASSSNYFAVGPDYYAQIDADNLQIYLNANQVISYPTTGSTWYDLSGYSNNATLINGPSFDSNGWFKFDGADDRGQFSSAIISGSGDFTLSAFVRRATATTSPGFILGNYGVGNNGVELYWYSNVIFFYATSVYVQSPTTHADTRWYHVVGSRIGGTGYIYVNGELEASSNLNVSIPTANPLTIGNGYDYTSEALQGDISEVAIYPNKGLTASEVLQNYYGGPIVTDGLVFALDAGNLVSYPKSGTSTYNLTGSGATGTLTNGTSFTPSDGGAFMFDGTNDYIVFPNDTNLDSQAITMESWNYLNTTTTQDAFLFEKGQVNTQYSNFYTLGNTFIFRTVGLSTWDLSITTSTYINPNTWNHVVCTYGAGTKTIYINGIQVAQQTGLTGTIGTNTTGLFLGAYGPGTGYFLNGKIAESRVYNRALTAAEVLQNYNATK